MMLETIREYAREKLQESGEAAELRQKARSSTSLSLQKKSSRS